MSTTREIYLTCDDCGDNTFPSGRTLKQKRNWVKDYGWTNPKRNIDYCRTCSEDRKAATTLDAGANR